MAAVLGGLVLALMIAEPPLAVLARQSVNASGGSVPVWFSAAFGVVGFVVARRRVQRAVDRRFNRARYDADQTIAAFAGRLKGGVDLDAVREDLAGVVQVALEPAHVSVWIGPG
jgi:hypothetical protein